MSRRLIVMLVAAGALAACGDNRAGRPKDANPDGGRAVCTPTRGSTITLRPVGQVPGIPVLVTAPPADPRLFVVIREGTIRIFDETDQLVREPFIDLTPSIYLEGTVELGLLGMAFHPQYATNGQFFVFYTTQPHSVVARCQVDPADRNRALPSCVPILQALHDTAHNHNGGMIEFGNDGYLYIGTGDGGGGGDPNRRSQNPDDLLGKILRIDVDARAPGLEYGIPPTNPYAGGGGRPEVFIRGLRNPWRWSFDRATGDLWIGDVGQNRAEEMTVLRPAQQAGANLGWSIYEGHGCCATQEDRCVQTASLPCDPAGITFPQDVHDRMTSRGARWYSIIAGQTYRGTCYPDLVGWHLFTDVEDTTLVKARLRADDTLEVTDLPGVAGTQTTSIHADARGELYLTKTTGVVYHIEAGP
ncbi:MAG: PQQ-dependent sugar dehydrogenase [Deltaproteobacteria bacterium]|nr:PQQ-dependent sugar dehydrogenase [Deltaproteobacteria bacterium]MDQ3296065.1 PQQ-dependent sugar dehydrogenase [Myxococcota bacterium]